MRLSQFRTLIANGENRFVDFKIICNALSGDSRANTELVKDIAAMSNNGYRNSYIIIGVSDDRRTCRSVQEKGLLDPKADDNLQRLCRDSIFPVPSVKLNEICYKGHGISRNIEGKKFVVIKIGPHPRRCFRVTRDLIDYKNHICVRKNDVWIRRNATSDTATPEEIAALVTGKDFARTKPESIGTDYTRAFDQDYSGLVAGDLNPLTEIAIKLPRVGIYFINLKIGSKKVLMRLHVVLHSNTKNFAYQLIESSFTNIHGNTNYQYHLYHGILIISQGRFTPSAMNGFDLKIQETWGWYCEVDDTYHPYGRYCMPIPNDDLDRNDLCLQPQFIVVLDNIKNSLELATRWSEMLNTISTDQDIYSNLINVSAIRSKTIELWFKSINKRGTQTEYEKQIISYLRKFTNNYFITEKED